MLCFLKPAVIVWEHGSVGRVRLDLDWTSSDLRNPKKDVRVKVTPMCAQVVLPSLLEDDDGVGVEDNLRTHDLC